MEKLTFTGPAFLSSPHVHRGTDGKYTRIAGIPHVRHLLHVFDINDNREHGKDRAVGVQDFYGGVDFNYR